MYRQLAVLLLVVLALFSYTIGAVESLPENYLDDWQTRLEAAATQLEKKGLSDEKLREIRVELEDIRIASSKAIESYQPDIDAVTAELGALGPAPAEGAEAEAAGVAEQRAEINGRLAALTSLEKETELVETRAARLLEDISEIRRNRFSQRIFTDGPSPLSIRVWRQAIPQVIAASSAGREAISNLINTGPVKLQLGESFLTIPLAAILVILFVWPLHAWLLRRYGRDPDVHEPGFMQAMRVMLVIGAVRALLPTAAAALVYMVAINTALSSPAAREVGKALFLGFVFFAWVVAFFRASLSPGQSAWRVLPVADNFAGGMWHYIILLSLVYAIDIVLTEVLAIYGAQLELTVLRDFLIALVVILLLTSLLLRQDMWRPAEPPGAKPKWRTMRMITALVLLVFPVIGAFGYVTLMKYVATQALLSGGLIFLFLILQRLGLEFIAQMASGDSWVATRLREYLHFDDETTKRLEFWSGIVYDIVLLTGGLLVGLFIWGANRDDISSWLYQALFGFQIGRIHIALVDIAVAFAIVAVLVIATRFVQRVLAEKVLPQTRMDIGIRESIRQAAGYIGMVIAAIAGISALGLDLSNFALVAGALTVGIGFGLQNVVNNFVSGLILLIERPVKVGDWIVVGDQQGYVKQIRVRATEIQTFDRGTVFIPNSELISGVVTNWTHADKLGRVVLPIGVAYGSDTALVKETLLQVARANKDVLQDPPPAAVFRGFGDSCLDFELRCILENVEQTVGVTSDLCFAIDKAFRDANIEIPFPQQDLYIREIPGKPAAES